jgi:hypothetical protein
MLNANYKILRVEIYLRLRIIKKSRMTTVTKTDTMDLKNRKHLQMIVSKVYKKMNNTTVMARVTTRISAGKF